ncbi:MAG: peptidylprolyl isomerase [Leptospirillia bacterium]
MTRQIQNGDTVTIHYIGRLSDGAIFDRSSEKDPTEFVVGMKGILPGINTSVVGMCEGECKTVTLRPEDAFGSRDPNLLAVVEANQIPEGIGVGDTWTDTENRRWQVLTNSGDKVMIDGNHKLAGQTITVELEIVTTR